MSIHNKQHGILVSDDHTPGTAPAAGEVNLIGIVRGSTGGIWVFYKNVNVYYVELTGI